MFRGPGRRGSGRACGVAVYMMLLQIRVQKKQAHMTHMLRFHQAKQIMSNHQMLNISNVENPVFPKNEENMRIDVSKVN